MRQLGMSGVGRQRRTGGRCRYGVVEIDAAGAARTSEAGRMAATLPLRHRQGGIGHWSIEAG
jgi:hypothetical protein